MAEVRERLASPVGSVDISYRTRPYVCGAIGSWDATVLHRLREASPPGLREVYSSTSATIWSSSNLERWRAGNSRGYFWNGLAEGRKPTSWQDAAEGRLAGGVQISDRGAILHTDALGLQDVYWRRNASGLYFSVRIEPLLEMTEGSLHTDWSAWADILAMTCPLGDSTPFKEVRRMIATTAWRAVADGLELLSFEPTWMSIEPDSKVTAKAAMDIVASRISGGRRTAITLSGGWDSRMLALAARRRGRRMVAWTTSKDDGYDNDLEYAKNVADALDFRHRIYVQGPEAWFEEHRSVRRRLSFQTNHHVWIMPLARVLHSRPEQFLDGLAGFLFKGTSFLKREFTEDDKNRQRRRLLWEGLEQNRLQRRHLLAPTVAMTLERLSRASFDQAVSRFDGHTEMASLGILYTRTARAIASSSHWLFAPEVRVLLPFIHPEVLTTAFSVPRERKREGQFYREMMCAADPVVAALPSTNDGLPLGKTGYMRQRTPRALAAMANEILTDDVALDVLGPEMRLALRDLNALSIISKSWAGLHILQWASMLGDWRSTYASRLADGGLDLP